jgi:hypothetical protein
VTAGVLATGALGTLGAAVCDCCTSVLPWETFVGPWKVLLTVLGTGGVLSEAAGELAFLPVKRHHFLASDLLTCRE